MMFPWLHGLTLRERGEGGARLWKKGERVISGHGNGWQENPLTRPVCSLGGGICSQTNGKLMVMNESMREDKVVGCQAQQHLHHRCLCHVSGSPSPPVTQHGSHVLPVLTQPLCGYFRGSQKI